ncbi:acyl-CoA N-acyltransferase [Auriculariales sp. MPI-PUGE-AT-0066]|nr:acyl-CoA N-acyltransferase [Auriculariales sp. MPI-PUGE-AT-0066]
MFFFFAVLPLFGLFIVSYSLPTSIPELQSIPSNAVSIAKVFPADGLVAYDAAGAIIGRLSGTSGLRSRQAQSGTCVKMSSSDMQKLPGWEKIAQYARDNWGDGWDTVNANPDSYPDSPALLCVTGATTPITLDGEPSCSTQHQSTGGTIVGTDGTVALSANQGTAQTIQVTVTQESSLAVGASLSVKVEIPAFAEITASITSTVTFSNTLSTANSFTSSAQQTETVTYNSSAGQTCSMTFDVQTCNMNGSGNVGMIGGGWVWFFYDERRNDHYQAHNLWAVSIEAVLSEQERETFIGFRTSTSASTNSQYNAFYRRRAEFRPLVACSILALNRHPLATCTPMADLVVRPATVDDATAIDEVRSAAFSVTGDTARMFPGSIAEPDEFLQFSRERTRKHIAREIPPTAEHVWLVCEDPNTHKLAAFIRFERVEDACASPSEPIAGIPFAGPDTARFLNELNVVRREVMGSRPHYYVIDLATHPSFQRRGAASALLSHLIKIADFDNTAVYIESSEAAVAVYKKFGLVETGRSVFYPVKPGALPDGALSTVLLRKPIA